MHRNNPFMYFRHDFRWFKESGTRGGSVLEESRDQVLCVLVFERWRPQQASFLLPYPLCKIILYFSPSAIVSPKAP